MKLLLSNGIFQKKNKDKREIAIHLKYIVIKQVSSPSNLYYNETLLNKQMATLNHHHYKND